MNVFELSLGQDTAGQSIRIKEAFDRHAPDWSVRSMRVTDNYLHYPVDLPFREHLVDHFYDAADVVHLHNQQIGHERYDNGQGKPTILHHHGTSFRDDHAAMHAEAQRIGAVEIVSTVDLEILEPGLTWLPAPYSAEFLAGYREHYFAPHDTIRIAHAPTNRAIKSTEAVIAAVESLAERYLVELVLIERRPWKACLALKATADIFVDQLILGYGCNAVEAWGMGIPVVCGVEDREAKSRMRELWGELPFYSATEKTLEKRLEKLIQSADLQAEYVEKGRAQFDRFHDERKVVAQLQDIYRNAPATTPGPARRPLPMTARRRRELLRGAA